MSGLIGGRPLAQARSDDLVLVYRLCLQHLETATCGVCMRRVLELEAEFDRREMTGAPDGN